MWKSFIEGYESSGAPPMHIVAGRVFGVMFKAAIWTIIAILVARCMGVPV